MGHINADIVCVQETQNTNTEAKLTTNYRYISNDAMGRNENKNGKGTGGIATLIKPGGKTIYKN